MDMFQGDFKFLEGAVLQGCLFNVVINNHVLHKMFYDFYFRSCQTILNSNMILKILKSELCYINI